MTINEFKDLKSKAKRLPHTMRVLYAAIIIAEAYKNADTDIIIAAALLHETAGTDMLRGLPDFDDEKILAFESCRNAAHGGFNLENRIEAKIIADAHMLEYCGATGAANLITDFASEKLFKTDGKQPDGNFATRPAADMAARRRAAADNFYIAFDKENSELSQKGEKLLDNILTDEPFYKRLRLMPKDGGFSMQGYFVWCGSVIFASGEYHMFASRWNTDLGSIPGYMIGSEIVRAVSKTPEGPYEFKEVVIRQRPRGYWDSQMAHNPHIIKIGDTYVLYYLGSSVNDRMARAVGYATSKSINGPWIRQNKSIDLGRLDCNNPSACIAHDGGILLVFRYANQRIGIARANRYNGEYTVVNEDILPGITAEDPFVYINRRTGKYEMIVEDGYGALTGSNKFGALLESDDGIAWRRQKPILAYDHTLLYDDLSMIKAERRERPQLLINADGIPTHLFTSVLYEGRSWNACQPIAPPSQRTYD